ncbi:fasciclin domain-containing protein [Penaeicola halotolerans]|uniref:fasciclin domain-containing protein n=1 Tax=Penaeicola halotolerans TaxID=2793196 RepID=UPI001CF8EA55|nr:fasciclin domain-containing protein [Penaeicola halotolerans]
MKRLAFLFLSVALFSCGGNSEQAAETTEETMVMEEPVVEEAPSIVDIAMSSENHKTLVAALQAAELVDVLNGDGPFTVFAPTDEAFAALDPKTLEDLLKPENKEKLAAILTYHVLPAKAMAADVTDGLVVATVNGAEVTLKVSAGAVSVNGANVVAADLEASNGVIHVIDKVILPPSAY